ncbi:membrane integrity-associated transporter subunit PqiC [Pseudomonas poae]|uniref:Membrane integrity-associated transporter subunit PqiC n=1 Tax=Pseudomonas poae TaxID=200451 RepID=A0A7M1KBU2_9PSED|nr:PqiC family protein [Pseudomonas poae]QOQ73594.1 membrane integrity-associated transporter subunit PqiC [Pseudomonas poae]
MTFPLKITLVGALLLLAACRSEPIAFHTLTPVHWNNSTQAQASDIRIESISVPPQVDRAQIVIRQGDSGVAILETQWWAATLADELKSALVDQLANSHSRQSVSLRVEVQRFDSVPGQYALLDVRWRLRPTLGGDAQPLTCRTTLQTPAGPSIDDLVVAHQNNLKRFAALVSKTADTSLNTCPTAPR